jgi:hypothetical protein
VKLDAGGRGRTDTPLRAVDFESTASANSATPAVRITLSHQAITGKRGGDSLFLQIDNETGKRVHNQTAA